ncbi:NUDIX hydrolase [Shouchella lonarensis]|uniref:NUDIX domain-containing protein n=1 Tax=Shouchella lonarensis TaxID=1464122 RepID=A0A1G6MX13_9BACI|nr:NUDIX domain-containing protein [Shouchella lonarensis]SDC59465.1 NUDIX domain-containing protein [Shouchella lonarensis]
MQTSLYKTTVEEQVNHYLNQFPHEHSHLEPFIPYVEIGHKDIVSRKTYPGHITASGIVFTNERLLMVFHPTLQKWLQPGGHVDLGESPLRAAQREVEEETGIQTALHCWHRENLCPIDINIHTIPSNKEKAEPTHLHYDFRYLLTSTNESVSPIESGIKTGWRNLHSIKEENLRNVIQKLVTLSLLKK